MRSTEHRHKFLVLKTNMLQFNLLQVKYVRFYQHAVQQSVKLETSEHSLVNIGKAGRSRHMGIRPTVRGSVMNPVDHPHGGGEGRTPIGRKSPMTPWGKKAMGVKTRRTKKSSTKLIVRRRNEK
ncbi:hypothetical protein MGH68_06420 [Erysipelothrix sp. D19-032]